MVALTAATPMVAPRRTGVWLVAICAVLVLGAVPRVVIGGTGDRSAALLALLLEVCVCAAVWLVASPRAAFVTALVAAVLLNVAAIRPRAEPPYDDRQALYKADQAITLNAGGTESVLPVWVEAQYSGDQPRFSLLVNGSAVSCAWQHGIQRIGVPVTGGGEVRLSLAGTPARDGDYLIVYSSAQQASIPLQADASGLSMCTNAG